MERKKRVLVGSACVWWGVVEGESTGVAAAHRFRGLAIYPTLCLFDSCSP
jgi:hypothetical protein